MPPNGASIAKKSLQYLESLQSWQLKHLCTATGLPAAAKKSVAAAALVHATTPYRQDEPNGRPRNIKSVDMGVKNLAYCLLQPLNGKMPGNALFRLLDWRRINVVTGESTTVDNYEHEDQSSNNDVENGALTNLYSPAKLAPLAARLAARLASDHAPAHVLIERQRYRSLGAAAVQEWTLRVNSLEMMLWASLQTLRDAAAAEGRFFPLTTEMNPARIAAYWNARREDWSLDLGGEDAEIVPRQKRAVPDEAAVPRGMEKAAKIGLVRHWLENGAVDVDERLLPLANAFMTVGRAKKADGDLVVQKKDDLADCVVQGVTFGIWTRNRSLLARHLKNETR